MNQYYEQLHQYQKTDILTQSFIEKNDVRKFQNGRPLSITAAMPKSSSA